MITLKQDNGTYNTYLYPDADGCFQSLIPHGAVNNYQCVDEDRESPDDETTYVSGIVTDLLLELSDFYELPDGQITTGTINYIQVYARAKSYLYSPSKNAQYKIQITTDDGLAIWYSNNNQLTNDYLTYNYIWLTNPSTGLAWTYADIDNLEIGEKCSSPTVIGASKISTFRPNGSGDLTQLSYLVGAGSFMGMSHVPNPIINYTTVNETTQDDDLNFICTSSAIETTDLYNIPNYDPATDNGIIQSISLFYVVKSNCWAWVTPKISIGGTIYNGSNNYIISGWNAYSYTWNSNPSTGTDWIWDDITDLQIGIGLQSPLGVSSCRVGCTQLYLVVNYKGNINPEIRTTQCYAKINYTTTSECTLQNPESIEMDHNQIINIINFWDGSREVYGLARGNKTMLMQGKEWNDEILGIDADHRIMCIRAMAKTIGEIYVNIGGAGSKEFDGTFRLLSFGWKKVSDLPKLYEWMLELEAID